MRDRSVLLVVAAIAAGCGPHASPAYTAPMPEAPPFVGSVFTQCMVYVTDSGQPPRPLQQQEFQISATTIGACPQYLTLSNSSNSLRPVVPGQGTVYYVSAFTPTDCNYVDAESPSDDFTTCKLAPAPAPAPAM